MEQLKYQAAMSSKEEAVFEMDNVRFEFGIMHHDSFQYLNLYFGLFIKLRLIPNNL